MKKFSQLAEHSLSASWWRNRLGNLGLNKSSLLESLRSAPVLTRSELQENWDEMQVPIKGSLGHQFVIASTSGSTGKPVRVKKYLPAFARTNMAAQLLTFRWHQIDTSKPMTNLRWNGEAGYWRNAGQPYSYLGETGPRRSIKLSDTGFEQALDLLSRDRSSILFANPTAISALLREGAARNYQFPFIDFFLSFAERLGPDLRKLVEVQSKAKIIDRYTTEEVGVVALQCPFHEHLHSISPHNFLEIVDEFGEPCEIGKPGRILITALNSYGMPLIRYELGDVASFGEPCTSGINLPVVEPHIVRIKENLTDSNGQLFSPSASGAKSLKQSKIRDFQVLLFENCITVLYEAPDPLTHEEVKAVQLDLQSRFRTELPVNCIFQESMSWAGYWKRKDFIVVPESFGGEFQRKSFEKYLGV